VKTDNVITAPAIKAPVVSAPAPITALAQAKARVAVAKTATDQIGKQIGMDELRRTRLKADLSAAVDELEAAIQAHDIAVRADQAARAVPVE
jgi:hypothetical protein